MNTQSNSPRDNSSSNPAPSQNNILTKIDTHGGDVAINSTIDKRSGGFYLNEMPKGLSEQSSKRRRNKFVHIILGAIIATILGLTANIVAAYLQENYSLINNTGRFLVVLFVFALALIASIGIAFKSAND